MKTMRKVLALCLGIMMLFSSLEGLPEAVAEVIEMTTEAPAPETGESGGSTEPQQEQHGAPAADPAGGGGAAPEAAPESGNASTNIAPAESTEPSTESGAVPSEGAEAAEPGEGDGTEATEGEASEPAEDEAAGEGEETEVGSQPEAPAAGTVEEISLSGAPKSAFVGEQINFLLHIQGTAQEYMVEWETETPDGTNKDSITTGAVDVLRSYIPHSYGTHTIRITVSAPDGSYRQAMVVIPVADHSTESEAEMFEAFEDYERTGNWNADVLAIAKSQIGTSESNRNFYIDNFDVTHGWTRYGAFYGGAEYDPWDALFVNFVVRMAGIPEEYLPKKGTTSGLQKAFADEGAAISAEHILTTAEPGDLVFVQGTDSMQVGVLSEISSEKIAVILGDCDDRVQVLEYENGSELVLGFGDLSVLYDKAVAEHAPTEVAPETPAPEAEEQDESEEEDGGRVTGRPGVLYYCGFAANYQHTHDESCYKGGDVPLCGLFEHTHTDECTQLPLKQPEATEEPAGDTAIEAPSTGEIENTETDDSTEEAPAQQYSCGLVEHSHSAECYSLTEFDTFEVAGQKVQRPRLICGMEEHHHDETCVPIEDEAEPEATEEPQEPEATEEPEEEVTYYCGMEEHTHSEECYDEEGNLICELPEHTHSDECLVAPAEEESEEPVYYCGMEEHTHSEECYDEEGNLICELPEHTHTDECLVPPEEEPEVEYICGMEEHTHTEECYDEEGNLICELEEHTHSEECVFDAFELRDQITTEAEAILAEVAEATAETPVATLVEYYNRMNDLYDLVSAAFEAGEISEAEYSYLRGIIADYVAQLMDAFRGLGYEPQVKVDVDAEFEYADENMSMTVHMLGTGELRDLAAEIDAEAVPEMVLSFEGEDGEAYTSVQEYIAANGPTSGIDYMAAMEFQFTLDGHELDMTGAQMDVTVLPTTELIEALTAGYSNVAQYREAQAAAADEAVELAPVAEHVENVAATEADINIHEESGIPEELQVLMDAVEGAENAESQIQGEIMTIGGTGTQIGVPGLAIGDAPAMDEPGIDEPSVDEPSEDAPAQSEAELEYIPVDPDTHQMESDMIVMNAVTLDEEGEPTVVGSSLQSTTGEVNPLGFSLIFDIGKKVTTTTSTNVDPAFTVQHYLKYNKIIRANDPETSAPSSYKVELSVLSTEGGKTPTGKSPKTDTVYLANDYTMSFQNDIVTPLYVDKATSYLKAPEMQYIDRFYNGPEDYKERYTLKEVWVSSKANATEKKDFTIYEIPEDPNHAGGHLPDSIAFLNYHPNKDEGFNFAEPAVGTTVNLKSQYSASTTNPVYVQITPNSTVRLVFGQKDATETVKANFFDYNITDGYIYSDRSFNGKEPASNQNDWDTANPRKTIYQNSTKQGVNLANDQAGDGPVYAFGNANSGSGYEDETRAGYFINRYQSGTTNKGASFEIVNGLKEVTNNNVTDVVPAFNGVAASDHLFDSTTQSWKQTYLNQDLTFSHSGSTYVLTGAPGVSNLDKMPNTYTEAKPIYSNSFWPMDSKKAKDDVATKDIYFGAKGTTGYRLHYNKAINGGQFPESDDGTDHNSFFGMAFNLEFTLDPGYVGPLDYFFYGDDDMWVFLQELTGPNGSRKGSPTLVCDIGGVHSAIGEYVNLWEFLGGKPTTDTGAAKYYRLYFYYTERGASGSTCYMNFTLPLGTQAMPEPEWSSLKVLKKVNTEGLTENEAAEAKAAMYEFEFEVQNKNGKEMKMPFAVQFETKYGYEGSDLAIRAQYEGKTLTLSSGDHFWLHDGESIQFMNLYKGWKYMVKEVSNNENFSANIDDEHHFVDVTQEGEVTFTPSGNDAEITFNNNFEFEKIAYNPLVEKTMLAYLEEQADQQITGDTTKWMTGTKEFSFVAQFDRDKTTAANKSTEDYSKFVQIRKASGAIVDGLSIQHTIQVTNGQQVTPGTFADAFYFLQPGTYVFNVYEVKDPSKPYIDYSAAKWQLTVEVGKRKTGTTGNTQHMVLYIVDANYADITTGTVGAMDEKAKFTNKVHISPVEYTPKFTKDFFGGMPEDTDTFTFTLSEIMGRDYTGIQYLGAKEVTLTGAQLKNPADPYVFGNIKFTQGGTYAWQIQETGHNTVKDCATDPHTWTLTVDVKEADGKLFLNAVTYDNADGTGKTGEDANAEFHNLYTEKTQTPPSGDVLSVGDVITYTITWANPYDHDATVTITDVLDKDVEYVAGSAVPAASYDAATHTLTWTIDAKQGQKNQEVSFQVEVLETARENQTDAHDVVNQANLDVDNEYRVDTNEVFNEVGEPHKKETNPGEGTPVEIGGKISYDISWRNYKNVAANVVITDKLEPGVDFVSASYGDVTLTEGQPSASGTKDGISVTIGFDATNKIVTWTLTGVPAKTNDDVQLVVQVNEKAYDKYYYPENGNGTPVEGNPEATGDKDYEVQNQAGVKVGNDDEMFTEIPWNPVPETHKTEDEPVKPGDQVQVNDTITYTIEWENYLRTAANVTVEDVLDPGVEFVSATPEDTYRVDVLDGKTVVTWNLENKAPKEKGTVTLTVKVLKAAEGNDTYSNDKVTHTDENTIWNQASMTVDHDNDHEFWTEEIPNVVPEKTEEDITHNTHPELWDKTKGGLDGAPVLVGDEITYNIQYRAIWNGGSNGQTTVVTVTDTLDPGVDFVSAAYEGVKLTKDEASPKTDKVDDVNVTIAYDGETVKWTLDGVKYGDVGNVKLTVKVNENARKNYQFKDGTPEEGNNKKGDANGDKYDYEVQNQAGVQIGDGNAVKYTQIPENPVPDPHKTEKEPGAGEQVQVGDKITYEIEWQNYSDNVATVTVSDVLDKGVKLVESETTEGFTYNESERKVVWTFENQEPKAKGTVKLVVEVTKLAEAADTYESGEPGNTHAGEDGAGEENTVWNQASVQVGNDPDVWTEEIPNVVPEKTETDITHHTAPTEEWDDVEPEGDDKDGAPVMVGDEITYNIQYKAMWALKEGQTEENATTTVVITDTLDPGVDFVSATADGSTVELTGVDTVTDGDVTIVYDGATVKWTIQNVPYGTVGNVQLTVKVNENAKRNYQFTDGTPVEGKNDKGDAKGEKYDYEVQNQAGVQIEDNTQYTTIPTNPVPDPHKTETRVDGVEITDSKDNILTVGSVVEYSIEWQNYEDVAAPVIVTDQLDPGVVFVSASYDGLTLTAEDASPKTGENGCEISYNDHTITWKLGEKKSKEQGVVTFVVTITKDSIKNAVRDWDYDELGKGDYADPDSDMVRDYEIVNQAKVKVGDNPDVRTEKPENPVFYPEKTEDEDEAGRDNPVTIGDTILYHITWQNYHDDKADVTVIDRLDPGVDFVSASFNGVEINEDTTSIEEATDNCGLPVSIKYVKNQHYVQWTLHNRPAKTGSDITGTTPMEMQGTVDLRVRVNENARKTYTYNTENGTIIKDAENGDPDFKVLNQAGVQVEGDDMFFTDVIPNPVSEPKKEETLITNGDVTIEDGEGKQVHVGDVLTYEITYQNYKYEELYEEDKETKSVVTVADTLHPGVDFVSASYVNMAGETVTLTAGNTEFADGSIKLEGDTVTWTISGVPMGYEGKVTLTVQVNKEALNWQKYGEIVENENAIYNQAHVTLDGDRTFDTKVIPNPVPEKKETDIERKPTEDNTKEGWDDKHGDTNKEPVTVGDWITYHIEYTAINPNGKDGDDVSVVVKDVLDPGVNFVSASYGDLVLDAKNTNGKVTFQKNSIELTTTEAGQQMVTWTLTEEYGTNGDVVLTVEVNEDAEVRYSYENGQPVLGDGEDFKVFDQASVNIDNQGDVYTDIVENPVDEPHKTEEEEGYPQDQDVVTVGETLKYDIEWHNSEEETATIIITDPLDKHVMFVSADNGGAYDRGSHTVTWTLENQLAGATGHVKLEVEVLPSIMSEDVVKQWIHNQAFVQVGNQPAIGTEVPGNPVGEPHKIETDPGYGDEVAIGSKIDYEISWKNYQAQAADVVVRDRLDPGVDFVSASYDGVTLNAGDGKAENTDKGITIEYDADAHMVTWRLSQRASGAYDKVALTVEVNDDARKTYTYNEDGTINKGAENGDPDYKVLDQAGVAVGDDAEVLTEIIPNPVPEKTEEEIQRADSGATEKAQMHDVTVEGDEFKTESGPTVFVGDVITYHITYGAHKLDSDPGARVDVHIYDELDPGVEFVSASNYGHYDETTHSVTWNFDVPNNTDGFVELKVRVTEKAIQADDDNGKHVVDNQAEVDVQVGNNGGVKTNIVENPTPEFTKTSETANQPVHMPAINADGTVEGDTITYTIHWKNYKNEVNEDGTQKLATVTITDTLDPGVTLDVVAMKALGVDYDTKNEGGFTTVIWTIENVEPLAEGNVKLIVKVNTDAPERWTYNEEDGTFVEDPNAPDGGYWVYNKAHMNVDNESEIYSEVIPNPVPHPEKTEAKPGEPVGVKPGDEIEYQVKWWNYAIDETTGEPIAQNVYVIDQLEPGLDYVSGSVKVYETDMTGEEIRDEIKVPSEDITYVNRKLEVKIAAGAGMYGIVEFTAKVNANAVYGVNANNEPTQSVDEMVANKAQVKIGDNGEAWTTNEVSNPAPKPHKEETEPGNGEPVKIPVYDEEGNLISENSQISYEIDWANYKTEADLKAEGAESAIVVITDKLDPGVDFVSASYEGVTLEGYAEAATGTATGDVNVTISVVRKDETTPYDTVTWTLENVPARSNRVLSEAAERAKGSMGTVKLTVQLNEKAVEAYRYELDEETGEPNGNPIYDEDTDGRWVYNQASVKVNRDNEMYTEVPKNPVPEPPKTEDEIDRQQANGTKQSITLTPDDKVAGGVPVKPGDEITYKIKWWNYETNDDGELVAADVTVTDALDEHVKFLEAGFDGQEPENAEITAPEGENGGTVKWTFRAGRNTEGWVWVKVEVLDSILGIEQIENQGSVQVGNHDAQDTNIIPNPPPKDEKTETNIEPVGGRTVTPVSGDENDWQNTVVFVGDKIEYTITYENDRNEAATVTITDELDPGVDFVSAKSGEVELVAGEDSASGENVEIAYDGKTVTWKIENVPARGTGSVTLVVVVNAKATPAGKVDNQAQVQVDNDAPYLTEKPENPTPEQEKTEVWPGAGEMVLPENLASQKNNEDYENIPQEITYQIAWENYQTEAATVTVTDNLDPGVDYKPDSWKCDGYEATFSTGDDGRHLSWVIENVPAGHKGVIEFTVTVNENAYDNYYYPEDGNEPVPGSGDDDMLYNRAGVQVGDDPMVLTDIIPNPVPEVPKTVVEITGHTDWTNPSNDTIVFVGDTITYEIGWWNYATDKDTLKPVAATVKVTDRLDEQVDFVSASYNGVALKAEDGASITEGGITIEYADHTVTWTIPADADQRGTVTLTVLVSERAQKGGSVINQAGVQVGEGHKVDSNPVENPIPDPHKTETAPGNGEPVEMPDAQNNGVGSTIDYEIEWANYKKWTEDAQTSTVVITDRLDPGVDFVEASFGSATLTGEATEVTGTAENGIGVKIERQKPEGKNYEQIVWTLTNVPNRKDGDLDLDGAKGTRGRVKLTVRVNENALEEYVYDANGEPVNAGDQAPDDGKWVYNQAGVRVGTDNEVLTEITENPVPEPPKSEPDIQREQDDGGDSTVVLSADEMKNGGATVLPGDLVTYEIEWWNFEKADGAAVDANVTVTDTLDAKVEFVAAGFVDPNEADAKLARKTADECDWLQGYDKTGAPAVSEDDGLVTWTFHADADATGKVWVQVRVLEDIIETEGIENQGSVQIGQHDAQDTNVIPNPPPKDDKTETEIDGTESDSKQHLTVEADGTLDGSEVFVGDLITYEIAYENYKATEATVTIVDKLDPGLTFKTASEGGEYDADAHSVTWVIENVPGKPNEGYTGTVTVTVEVNHNATRVGEVINEAHIQVDHDPVYDPNPVQNPTPEQEKTEVTPGAGEMVLPQNLASQKNNDEYADIPQAITYQILWQNYQTQKAKVTVTDNLDPGVDYVQGSWKCEGYRASFSAGDDGRHLSWVINDVPAGAKGVIEFTVTVNENAYNNYYYPEDGGEPVAGSGEDDMLYNRAGVQVGDDPTVLTDIIPNPVPEVPKSITQITGSTNWTNPPEDTIVFVGDTITYEIGWWNYATDKDTLEPVAAEVTVTDRLDEKVDFVSASEGSVYDAATRTVTWTIAAEANERGTVTLTVVVNDQANSGANIVNQAGAKVGEDHTVASNPVENPTPELEKEELTPGADETVHVGDGINYQIHWKNYKPEETDAEGNPKLHTVVITDRLDPGVDFLSASYAEGSPEGDEPVYDKATHTVTWTLHDQPGQAEGWVLLNVQVNAKASDGWHYENGTPVADAADDDRVINQGGMHVDNDAEVLTNPVENPVPGPKKTETLVDHQASNLEDEANPPVVDVTEDGDNYVTVAGPEVFVGDEITYEITWRNYDEKAETSDITITDPLDRGVDFVRADNNGSYSGVTNHTVTWVIPGTKFGDEGKVSVTVRVNASATQTGVVENYAHVQVGNNPADETEHVDNPTPNPRKEVAPGTGSPAANTQVDVGDLITYRVRYKNYKPEAATVTVRDRLDPDESGLDFIEAWAVFDGQRYSLTNRMASGTATYVINPEAEREEQQAITISVSGKIVTWTMTNRPAAEEAYVYVTAQVNASALEGVAGTVRTGEVINYASVQVGDDPEVEVEPVQHNLGETPTPPPGPGGEPEPGVVTTSLTGNKFWNDNGDAAGLRPDDITVTLYRDGVAQPDRPTWTRNGNTWTYRFDNLPMYVPGTTDENGENGTPYRYEVRETVVPPNYQMSQNGNDITNTLLPPNVTYTAIAGTKTWNDNNDAAGLRPDSITVRLYRDGVEIDSVTVTAETNWSYSFTRLPVNDGYGGANYVYTVSEDPVENYYTVQNGTNFVNGLIPGREPGEPGPGDFTIINDAGVPLFGLPTEEELEDLIQLFDYDTPLWGDLMKTGDELPIYPFLFAGLGAAIVAVLLVDRKKRKAKAKG